LPAGLAAAYLHDIILTSAAVHLHDIILTGAAGFGIDNLLKLW